MSLRNWIARTAALVAFGGACATAVVGLAQTARVLLSPPTGPAVGVYRIRAVDADLCIGWRPGGGPRLPYLATSHCDRGVQVRDNATGTVLGAFFGIPIPVAATVTYPGSSDFVVLPHAAGGFTIRSGNEWPARGLEGRNAANRLLSCVTAARGVVFGSPGMDVWACEQPPGGPRYEVIGTNDQRFFFKPVGPAALHRFNILVGPVTDQARKCVTVRGGGRQVDTDLAVEDCNDAPSQVFEFNYLAGVAKWRDDEASALAQGWVHQAKFGMLAAIPAKGVVLMGGDFDKMTTSDDEGRACAVTCVENSECKAFTWVRPGVQGPAAMCWIKGDGFASPNADSNTNSGWVRP